MDVNIYNQRSDIMAISITGLTSGKGDVYSNLLSSGTVSSASGLDAFGSTSLLSDYASIKNGSYGKMMKAYYQKQEDASETSSDSKTEKEKKDTVTASSASSAYKSAEKLNAEDFSEDNKDNLYTSISSFVKEYNSMIKNASNSELDNVRKQADWLNDTTYANFKLLSSVGITMNTDRTLSLDEDIFKKANVSTVKSLFAGNGSYADRVSAKASQIYRYANGGSSITAKSYTSTGSYSQTNTEASTINSVT